MLLSKAKKASKYILYVIYTNIIYGFLYYFLFSWLVGYSLLLAYLGCFVLIVIGLIIDNVARNNIASEKTISDFDKMNSKEKKINYKLLLFCAENFVSFKTVIFVFYVFILILSQIISINPSLAGENLRVFISANSYIILLLIAVDMIVAQFSKDKKEMNMKAEILKETLGEKQDKQ